jgi:hypothetical protein
MDIHESIPEENEDLYRELDLKGKTLEQCEPPPNLARVLEFARTQRQNAYDIYNEFLLSARQANTTCNLMKLPIEASYKLVGSVAPEKLPDADGRNDTLIHIFDFYARIKQHIANKTFSEQQISFSTLTFSKVEVFCRDFQIIPKLLTREDVKILWEEIANEYMLKGLGTFTTLDFINFKDLIIRMALWSYYKPGLKKLILITDGFLPKPKEIVSCFSTFLHLYDDDYIANFLRTIGRKTQADYNYRSKDETNLRTKMEVRADTTARTMKQVTKKAPKSATPGTATTRKGATGGGGGDNHSVSSSSHHYSVNEYGDKVKIKTVIKPANPNDVISNSKSNTIKHNKNLHNATSNKKHLPPLPTTMIDRFENLKNNGFRVTGIQAFNELELADGLTPTNMIGMEGTARAETGGQFDQGNNNSQIQFKRSNTASRPNTSNNFFPSGDDDDDDEDDESSWGLSRMSQQGGNANGHSDNSIEALKEMFKQHYEPSLVHELLIYCYVPPRTVVIDWIPTFGPLVDLGLLEPYMKVTINYRLVNNTGDDIVLDTTTKDIGCDDTDMKTFAKPLVPGLSRLITVTFSIPPTKITKLGFIEIFVLNVRSRMRAVITCPVFYYVDPDLEKSIYPTTNNKSLPDMVAQRLATTGTPKDITARRIHTSFETKKSFGGTWSNSIKGLDSTKMDFQSLNITSNVMTVHR